LKKDHRQEYQNCQTNWFAKAMHKPLKKGGSSTKQLGLVSLCTGRLAWFAKGKSASERVGFWFEETPQKCGFLG